MQLSVLAIDIDSDAIKTIANNVKDLRLSDRITVRRANISGWSRNHATERFDIVLADPPYDDVRPDVLARLTAHVLPDGLFVLSWPGGEKVRDFDGMVIASKKQYGDAQLVFYRRPKLDFLGHFEAYACRVILWRQHKTLQCSFRFAEVIRGRSRLAAAYFYSLVDHRFNVTSSGIGASRSADVDTISPYARDVAGQHGLTHGMTKRHTQTTNKLLADADVIVFMNKDVYDEALKSFNLDIRKCLVWHVRDIDKEAVRKAVGKGAEQEFLVEATMTFKLIRHKCDRLLHDYLTRAAWLDVSGCRKQAARYASANNLDYRQRLMAPRCSCSSHADHRRQICG